jgi:hypothetical protein
VWAGGADCCEHLRSARPAAMASRLETKMQAALAAGDFYEAAELCKALASRAAAKKDAEAAAALLAAGAAAQIRDGAAAGGVRRGMELATQMVTGFRAAKTPADETALGALSHTRALPTCLASRRWVRV